MRTSDIVDVIEKLSEPALLRQIGDAVNRRLAALKSPAGKGTKDVYKEVPGHPTNEPKG